jgi:hypothetical protein
MANANITTSRTTLAITANLRNIINLPLPPLRKAKVKMKAKVRAKEKAARAGKARGEEIFLEK